MQADQAVEIIRLRLSKKKYQHSRQVADTAVQMARRFGIDESRTYLAGLLHDYARDLAANELLEIAEKNALISHQVEREVPDLLHGPVGAFLLEKDLLIKDEDILSAVRHHTLGAVPMTDLEKVIFIADMIEPGRSYTGVGELRELAFKDLDEAMLLGLESSIQHCLKAGKILHPITIEARNCFLQKVNTSSSIIIG